MNLPPALTVVSDKVIAAGDSVSIMLAASDAEGDPLTYHAAFLPPGASFDTTGGGHRFAWRTTLAQQGNSYWVKFWVTEWGTGHTAGGGSGATASRVVKMSVIAPGARLQVMSAMGGAIPGFGNPSRGGFALATPYITGTEARLEVFTVSGRKVGEVHGRAGDPLIWMATDMAGRKLPSGIYLYHAAIGPRVISGKWVLLR